MGLFISAIATVLVGLSLTANPAKFIKNIQAKTNTQTNVTTNTSTNIDVESDEKLETNSTANVTDNNDENQGKAEGHIKISAFNNNSGKFLKPLIPKVAVDHSDSLDVSGNVTLGVGKDK